jgi:hypothetical protein
MYVARWDHENAPPPTSGDPTGTLPKTLLGPLPDPQTHSNKSIFRGPGAGGISGQKRPPGPPPGAGTPKNPLFGPFPGPPPGVPQNRGRLARGELAWGEKPGGGPQKVKNWGKISIFGPPRARHTICRASLSEPRDWNFYRITLLLNWPRARPAGLWPPPRRRKFPDFDPPGAPPKKGPPGPPGPPRGGKIGGFPPPPPPPGPQKPAAFPSSASPPVPFYRFI